MTDYHLNGQTAFCAGLQFTDNPYEPDSIYHYAWAEAWMSEYVDRLRELPIPNAEDPTAEYLIWLQSRGLSRPKPSYLTPISHNE